MSLANYKLHLRISAFKDNPFKRTMKLSIDDVVKVACETTGCTIEQFLSKKRVQTNIDTRMLVSNYLRIYRGYTLVYIGKIIGNKNHATVIHAIRRFNNFLDSKDKTIITLNERFLQLLTNESNRT